MEYLIKICTVFVIIFILNRLKFDIGLAILIGATTLGFLMHLSFLKIVTVFLTIFTNSSYLLILTSVGFIVIFINLLEKGEYLEQIVIALTEVFPNSITSMAVLPALIGLLPMPGGALVSAPIVEEIDKRNVLTPIKKSLINYWFRHIWEYCWPLYPGVLLVASFLNLPLWLFSLAGIPFTLLDYLIGYLCLILPERERFLSSKHKAPASTALPSPNRVKMSKIYLLTSFAKKDNISAKCIFNINLSNLFKALAPVIIIILVFSLLEVVFFLLPFPLPRYTSINIALISVIIWLIRKNKNFKVLDVIKSRVFWKTIFPVVSILYFEELIISTNLIYSINSLLSSNLFSVSLGMFLLPFIAGWITGISLGFIGTALPVVFAMPVFHNIPLFKFIIFAFTSYCFGFMGVMLSPVHLCLMFSCEYFKVNLSKVYLLLLPLVFFFLIIVFIIFSLTGV